jgi:hypothetical protein
MRLRANTPRTETGKNRGLRGQRQVILISRLPVAINLRLGPRKPPSIADKSGKPLLKRRLLIRLLGLGHVRSPKEVVAILVDRR